MSVKFPTMAERVCQQFDVNDVETLTRWCISNNIVYPDPTWDEKELHFTGWKFSDGSRVIFDDNNTPHIVS